MECGASGTIATTANQIGTLARICTWVNQAWGDLQCEHPDWAWLRSTGMEGGGASFQTVAGQETYPLGTGAGTSGITSDQLGSWDKETFRCFTTTTGYINETFLDYVPYDVWRDAYMLGAMRNVQTRPVVFSIAPDESVCLGPPPNGLYTVTADYFAGAQDLVNDTDIPQLIPSKYHMAIVFGAMMHYAGYESAPEVYQRGSTGYNDYLRDIEALKLPTMTFGGALC